MQRACLYPSSKGEKIAIHTTTSLLFCGRRHTKLDFFCWTNKAKELIKFQRMAQQPSDDGERRPMLNFNVLYMILMDYLDKDQDIVNFIRTSKLYYEQFRDMPLLHNVLHGKCTALERAVQRSNMALIDKILEIPIIEAAAPPDLWPKTVSVAMRLGRVDLARLILQFNCVQTSIDEEAQEIALKGRETWEKRGFWGSWLKRMWDAIRLDKADVVELFLSLGMTVELCGPDGSTSLHKAAEDGASAHLMRLLLQRHKAGSINTPTADLWNTPLTLAARKGKAEIVKLLLEHGADPCFGGNGGFCRALAAAASKGHEDVVKMLSQDGRIELNAPGWSEPDPADNSGFTILGHAVKCGKPNVVQMLLENERVDPNATAVDGRSPLLIAARGINYDEYDSGLTMTRLLLSDSRVDIFLRDSDGWNALFWAARHGKREVLEMYLTDGRLDPNATDHEQRTAASCARSAQCLQLLTNDPRVDLNLADDKGTTPLIANVDQIRLCNVKQLVKSGRVDVNQTDDLGDTALMMACRNRSFFNDHIHDSYEIMRCLLNSRSVQLDLVNAHGETALMVAVKQVAETFVWLILDTGHCMADIRDASGTTMIEYAIYHDSGSIVGLLLETGEVQVTQGMIESAQSEDIRDMLMRYKERME